MIGTYVHNDIIATLGSNRKDFTLSELAEPNSAISSWSGFVYQRKVALYHSLKLIIEGEKDFELQLFHVYSGRLIQNYQRGLGLFIESKDSNQLRFATAEYSDHDAMLSSSGQISALSLAFFLSLNRVYSSVPIIMIDDPSQSLDEINIASLTDLLRCELKDRQLIVSSHEDDNSSYMRYRFARAGLLHMTFNIQSLNRISGQ